MNSRREFLRAAALAACSISVPQTAAGAASQTSSPFRGIAPGQEREVERIKLCWCPPGQFLMGSPPDETGRRSDESQVRVTLTQGFWIAKFEVTQAQWTRVVGAFPDQLPSEQFGLGEEYPVYWVNYAAAESFCRRLSSQAVRSGALPGNWEFRLPTEAQWEYACRAATATATSFGHRLGRHQANFRGAPLNGGNDGPAHGRAMRVGNYPPNQWGVCDMHGNIFEWCRDWYHSQLPGGADPDLSGKRGTPNRDGTYSRVRRGGAWTDAGETCRSAYRLRYEPERTSDHIGFRCVAVARMAA